MQRYLGTAMVGGGANIVVAFDGGYFVKHSTPPGDPISYPLEMHAQDLLTRPTYYLLRFSVANYLRRQNNSRQVLSWPI